MLRICKSSTVMCSLKEGGVRHPNPETTPHKMMLRPKGRGVGAPCKLCPTEPEVMSHPCFSWGHSRIRLAVKWARLQAFKKIRQFIAHLCKMFTKIILCEELLIKFLWSVGLSHSSFPALWGMWHLGHHTTLGREPMVKCHRSAGEYACPPYWLCACP